MNPDQLGDVLSSKARLRIVGALAIRSRTLGELGAATGISVQGVLRHLKRLEELGLVEESKLLARAPKARRVYSAKGVLLGDYSTGDMVAVKATEKLPARDPQSKDFDIERRSGDILVQRRRIRDDFRRLGKMIDELTDDQEAMMSALVAMELSDEERLVLEVIFTEDTLEDGVRALSKYYGIEDRRSIDKALAKVARIARK